MREIDLDEIANESSKTTVQSITIANGMGLVNDEQDLQQLIKAGIMNALEELMIKLGNNVEG